METPPDAATETARTALVAVLLSAAVLGALWALDVWVLRTRVLTIFRGLMPLTPLYAFWNPLLQPTALLFAGAATLAVVAAPALADPRRTARGPFVAALLALALLLPATLFLVRQPWRMLGSQFVVYPGEEFIADADRIERLRPFLAHYVQSMREHLLSRHGAHFPPGHAVLLYGVRLAVGPGVFPAAVVVWLAFGLAIVVAFLALRTLLGEAPARAGAVLLLASPSLLDYACTSMDAVFLLVGAVAWWASLRAFGPAGGPVDALVAGALLLLATGVSFSTFPIGLAVAAYAVFQGPGRWRHEGRQLALAGLAYVGAAGVVFAATGFALWACVEEARTSGIALMTRIIRTQPSAIWGHLSYGNLVAFLIGSGVALVAATALRLRAGGIAREPWTLAALATIAVMGLGGIYFMETERIWLFAMPWLAAIAVARGAPPPGALRVLLAAGCAQALAMEVLLYTLW